MNTGHHSQGTFGWCPTCDQPHDHRSFCPTCHGIITGETSQPDDDRCRCPEPGGQPLRLPHLLDETLQLLMQLGRGRTGVTYLARSGTSLVALKLAPRAGRGAAELADLAERYARQRAYEHYVGDRDDIVHTIHSGEAGGMPSLVMEYVRGETLEQLLGSPGEDGDLHQPQRRRPLEPLRALRLVRRIAVALGKLHHHRLVHGGLRPGCIFVVQTSAGERIKVGGLGGALLMPHSDLDDAMDTAETFLTGDGICAPGTPYMSPEQARGDRTLRPAADLYCLGVLAYEMLTGRLPYRIPSPSPSAWIDAHLSGELVPLLQANPLLPAALEPILSRCLARGLHSRFQSTNELVEQLAPLEQQLPEAAAGDRSTPPDPAGSAHGSGTTGEVVGLAMERDRLRLKVQLLTRKLATAEAQNRELQGQLQGLFQPGSTLLEEDREPDSTGDPSGDHEAGEAMDDQPTQLRPEYAELQGDDPERHTLVLPGALAEALALRGPPAAPMQARMPVVAPLDPGKEAPRTIILHEFDLEEIKQARPVDAAAGEAAGSGGFEVETLPDEPSWERGEPDDE